MTAEQYEATFFEGAYDEGGYRRVGQDIVIVGDEPCHVSTVWIGIDVSAQLRPDGRPLIFETMVVGGPYEYACVRYATEMDAQEGHARTVTDLMAGIAPWFMRDEDVDVMRELS